MNTRQIDYLNIFLVLLSLLIAYQVPFHLFLLGYAILGPLHYLTEIRWIRDKQYFVPEKKWVWIALGSSLLFILPYVFSLPWLVEKAAESSPVSGVISWLRTWSNGFIFIPLVLAASFLFIKKKAHLYVALAAGVVLMLLLNTMPLYMLVIGTLLPTVIHVFVFTILFMLYGSLKSRSKPGLAAAFLALLVPLIIVLVDIQPSNYLLPDILKQTFLDNNFHVLNARLAELLGTSNGTTFFFYETADLKIQIFISFAYIYHYLNWFSKTSVIGWHKNLTQRQSIAVIGIWILAICLYAYDYRVGFVSLLFLSMLHVFLEFPLNIISVKGIISETQKLSNEIHQTP